MPGPHVPPIHQARRQPDHPHAHPLPHQHQHQHQHQHPHQHPHHYYHMPPQAHSPVHHNPYAPYHPQQHYAGMHAYPAQMPHMPQWYPYQPAQQLPQQQPQYAMPPRQFQPHASPVVVSSHLHMAAPMPPINRALGHTPPIVHSHAPPVHRIHTPSTPSVHSQQHLNSPTPPADATLITPPAEFKPADFKPADFKPTEFRPAEFKPTEFNPSAEFKPAEVKPVEPKPASPPASVSAPTTFKPFYPPLPWLSVPDADFPPRAAGRRRRKRAMVPAQEAGLALPSRGHVFDEPATGADDREDSERTPTEGPEESQASTAAVPSDGEVDTPSTSHPPSEVDLPHAAPAPTAQSPASAPKHARTTTKPAVPLIPIKSAKAPSAASTAQQSTKSPAADKQEASASEAPATTSDAVTGADETPKASSPAKPSVPKSWAELLRAKAAAPSAQPQVQPQPAPNGIVATNGPVAPKSNSLADVLASYSVGADKNVSFIEPRGLVNTGNLCYMNSILQVLLFCVPFYDFLDQVAQRAVHSFKSETPLIDAMIMFMRDFKMIDSAESIDQLRLRLKDNELEQYGDPLTPEYVYDAIKRLPRFDNMKRGSQEDAEEFLGFLLAGLHDDCAHVIKTGKSNTTAEGNSEGLESADSGWLEVTAKQKTATTQSSGAIEVETPITKIFGGKLRSEYKKPGEKPSVTLEPYQPLQLDIGEPHINNISDALKNLTRLETLDSGVRGARAATKQVYIETLPPVLILHLKRFHYDEKGPQKIWKKIGYPLELEVPKEAFPPHKRGIYQAQGGFPRYRLTGVVYHHGKNASGGHYTVDLRRQEGKEWIRMDDTILRRVRAEDVAEGGAEEDPKVLAAALEQHKNDANKNKNFFAQIDVDDDAADKGGWNQVNGSDKKETKKWAGLVNGTATPSSAGKRTPLHKENARDNKVAYILFYQRIDS